MEDTGNLYEQTTWSTKASQEFLGRYRVTRARGVFRDVWGQSGSIDAKEMRYKESAEAKVC